MLCAEDIDPTLPNYQDKELLLFMEAVSFFVTLHKLLPGDVAGVSKAVLKAGEDGGNSLQHNSSH